MSDVNHFYVTDYDLPDFIVLQMVVPRLEVEPLGNINETPLAAGTLSNDDFSYYEGGIEKALNTVTLSATGELVVRVSGVRAADGILAIRPFNPRLRGKTGSVNGGGIVQITVPPSP